MAHPQPYLVIAGGAFTYNPKWVNAHTAEHGCSVHAAKQTLDAMLKEDAEEVLTQEGEDLLYTCERYNIHPHYPVSLISQIMKKVIEYGYACVPDEADFNRVQWRFNSKEEAWAVVKESEVRFPGTMNKPVGGYVFQLDGYYSTKDLEAILYLRRSAEAKNPDDDRLPWTEHGNFGVADTQYRRSLKPNLY